MSDYPMHFEGIGKVCNNISGWMIVLENVFNELDYESKKEYDGIVNMLMDIQDNLTSICSNSEGVIDEYLQKKKDYEDSLREVKR